MPEPGPAPAEYTVNVQILTAGGDIVEYEETAGHGLSGDEADQLFEHLMKAADTMPPEEGAQ